MGVYIKSMKMPENCWECEIKQYDEYEEDYVCPFRFSGVVCLTIGRQDSCPLVALPEKHGRLIDADKLMDDVKKNSASYFADDFAREWVDVQPTVIEAEGE